MASSENSFTNRRSLFNHDTLPESISWLYIVPVDRLNNALADAFEESESIKIPFSHCINYLSHNTLNAAAWHIDPAGCAITIYSSTPPLVLMACMQFAKRCNLKTAIPMENNGRLVVYENRLKILTELDSPLQTASDMIKVVECFARKEDITNPLGLFLTEIALKFIAMHECMHVILGHTKFMQVTYGLRSFLEFSASRSRRVDPAFLQMLEFAADRNTVRGLFIRLLKNDFDEFFHQNLLKDISVNSNIYLLRCLVHAFSILFHLFPGGKRSIHTPGLSHPHPYIRARWLCNELMQELDENSIDLYEPLKAMTWASASLSCNFELPATWETASNEDFDESSKQSFADISYRKVMIEAKKYHHQIQEQFAPRYPPADNT